MQKKRSTIIIDNKTYIETARTPLHIEYEYYETYTDKEGHEHSCTLVETRPRNFLGKIFDWLDDVSVDHPIAFYGTVFGVILAILIPLFILSSYLIKEGFDFDLATGIVYVLTVAYLIVGFFCLKSLISEVTWWWRYDRKVTAE